MFSVNSTTMTRYLMIFGIVAITSYIGTRFTQGLENKDNEYELIKKYLLNESPLYGFNRPKIWIHSKYEVNARAFHSRNTTDLNQPYLHMTIQTIINHCGNDFNICLIDDETFGKLIPSWDINLANVAEPMKSHYREIGMLELLYYYGGLVLPNSLICLKNLKPFFSESIDGERPFICENINKSINIMKQHNGALFSPSTYIMGAPKNNSVIKDMLNYVKQLNQSPHFSSEMDFRGDISHWCEDNIRKGHMNLVSGQKVGVKTMKKKPILLEDLMDEEFIDVSTDAVAIYIPGDDILKRTKYQWFASLSEEEIMKSKMIISKYLKASIIDSTNEYSKSTEIPSVVSI